MWKNTPLTMAKPADRAALVDRLIADGLPAAETDMGDGFWSVSVPLVADNGKECLSIDAIMPCMVGLSGYRTDPEINEGDPIDCMSLEAFLSLTLHHAAGSFRYWWEEREKYIRFFREGKYDMLDGDEDGE